MPSGGGPRSVVVYAAFEAPRRPAPAEAAPLAPCSTVDLCWLCVGGSLAACVSASGVRRRALRLPTVARCAGASLDRCAFVVDGSGPKTRLALRASSTPCELREASAAGLWPSVEPSHRRKRAVNLACRHTSIWREMSAGGLFGRTTCSLPNCCAICATCIAGHLSRRCKTPPRRRSGHKERESTERARAQ